MKNNTVVVYESKYGTTEKYAKWIAEDLNCPVYNLKGLRDDKLNEYDTIIHGGGLYAGGVAGSKILIKMQEKNIVLFTVGLADPNVTDYTEVLEKNFDKELIEKMKIFHLRGGIDYKNLSLMHKIMMSAMKKLVSKKSEDELTHDDKMMLETYGDIVDFVDRKSIEPIIEYIKYIESK